MFINVHGIQRKIICIYKILSSGGEKNAFLLHGAYYSQNTIILVGCHYCVTTTKLYTIKNAIIKNLLRHIKLKQSNYIYSK